MEITGHNDFVFLGFLEKTMPARYPVLLTLVIVSFLALSGCGGGGAKVQSTSTTTTMGQELSDLDKVRQQGLISDSEYEKAKKDILKRYGK